MTDSERQYHGDDADPDNDLQRPPTTAEVVRDFLEDNARPLIAFFVLIGGGALLIGYEPEVPRFWYVFGLAGLFVSPYGYILGAKLKTLIVKPNDVWVIDFDARYADGALFKFPYQDFREFEVLEDEVDMLSPNLCLARSVDLQEGTLKGIWSGTIPDRELMVDREKIKLCRGLLEQQAKKGFTLETQFFSIVRGAVRDTVLEVVETFEKGSLPDKGKNLNQHIDSALEDHNMEDPMNSKLDDLDLKPEDAEYLQSMLPDNQPDPEGPADD